MDAIGQAVIAVGGLIVEYKKSEALKEIVPIAHKQIIKIGTLLQEEFNTFGSIAVNIDATGLKAVRAAEGILDNCKIDAINCSLAAEANKQGLEASKWANNVFPMIVNATDEMIKAHTSLKNSLENDSPNLEDIKSFSNSIQKLLLIVKILSEN